MSSKIPVYINSTGAYLTKSLFLEYYNEEKYVLYTLKDQDKDNYPSLHQLYLLCADPTEWSFANQYFYGWDHWEVLCECSWFKPYIQRWRKELEIKIRSDALLKVQKTALDAKHKSSYEANKYLLSGQWVPKDPATGRRGRPSKDEIKQEASRLASEEAKLQEDLNRIVN